MRLKTSLLTATSVALAFGLAACGSDSGSGGGDATDPIKVGVAVPLTGGSAILGTPMRNSIEIAVKQLNDAGGIDGRKIQLSVQDVGGDDTSALNALNRLTSDDPAAVIGFPISTQGYAVMTQVDRNGIPVIMSGTNAQLAAGSDWAFNMISNDATTSTAAVEYAARDLGYKRIALLRESGELGTGAAKVVKAAAQAEGIQVVADEVFQTGEKDLSAQATALARGDAQMIFSYGQQADFIVIGNALAAAGVKLPTLLAGLQSTTYAQLNNAGFAKVYNRGQCVPSGFTEGAPKDFVTAYQAAYSSPPTEYAAVAYDGMNLLISGLKSAGTDPAALRDALAKAPQTTGVCGVHKGGPDGNLSFGVTIGSYDDAGTYTAAKTLEVVPAS